RCDLADSGIGLLVLEVGDGSGHGRAEWPDLAGLMDEAHMHGIERVLDLLEPIRRPCLLACDDEAARPLEHSLARQLERWGGAFPQVREHEPAVLMQRIAADLDLGRLDVLLGRHLRALSRAVVPPAVIDAPDLLPLDPSGMKVRTAVGAARIDKIRPAA